MMIEENMLESFIRDRWMRAPWNARVSAAAFDVLRSELASFDVEALIRRQSGPVSVWFEDKAGNAQAVDVPAGDAVKFHRAGFTVFLPDVATDTVRDWQSMLGKALGRPPSTFLCSLFSSSGRNVTACHFDQIDNLTVQLSGAKRWRYAPNRHVPLPTVNYNVKTPRPYKEEMWLYSSRELPTRLPDGAELVELTAGHMIYLPRGMWHEVESVGDSVSLLLGFGTCTWIDVLLPALRTLLLRQEEWRASALLFEDAAGAERARACLRPLLTKLARTLTELNPADVLPAVLESDPRVLRPNPLATFALYPSGGSEVDVVVTVHQGELTRAREARVPSTWQRVLEHLAHSHTTETDQLATAFPEVVDAIPNIVKTALELKLVRAHAHDGASR
jgi:50S ribosomal protein L16 3-hydroxylase